MFNQQLKNNHYQISIKQILRKLNFINSVGLAESKISRKVHQGSKLA